MTPLAHRMARLRPCFQHDRLHAALQYMRRGGEPTGPAPRMATVFGLLSESGIGYSCLQNSSKYQGKNFKRLLAV